MSEDLKDELKEALYLLRQVDDYGIRLQMGGDWCNRLDALIMSYGNLLPYEDDVDEIEWLRGGHAGDVCDYLL